MIMTTRCSKPVKTTAQPAVVPRRLGARYNIPRYPDRQRNPKTKLIIRTFHESIGFEFEEGYLYNRFQNSSYVTPHPCFHKSEGVERHLTRGEIEQIGKKDHPMTR